jgi:hypothetical protein
LWSQVLFQIGERILDTTDLLVIVLSLFGQQLSDLGNI